MKEFRGKPKDHTLRFAVVVTEGFAGTSFDVVAVGSAFSVATFSVVRGVGFFERVEPTMPEVAVPVVEKAREMAVKAAARARVTSSG